MSDQFWAWTIFNVFVVAMLILDQVVFHRRAHAITMKEAIGWSAFWVSLAILFNIGIYFWQGPKSALEFLTGYLIEESLSIDNLFIFMMIFSYFKVPLLYQHKVLFWGIIGAQVMRAIFILVGVAVIHKFHWVIYIFGVFLIYTGIKMAFHREGEVEPQKNPAFRLAQRFLPITDRYDEGKFFTKINGRNTATPLFAVLLVIEMTDLMFALDSIPAVLAITLDPFIVYTSNVFAILGLRSMYFVLARFLQLFHYLHHGLSVILIFVGLKMLLADIYKIPIGVALGVVVATLALSVMASLIWPRKSGNLKVSNSNP